MPTLVIYRNGSLERQVELGERDLRIGRGDQNDVVLTDPAKSISRFHAEVRLENDRRFIIDLNSQNGTWVDGQRVERAEMVPGVPVTMGPFTLVLSGEAGGAVPPPPPTVIVETADSTARELPLRMPEIPGPASLAGDVQNAALPPRAAAPPPLPPAPVQAPVAAVPEPPNAAAPAPSVPEKGKVAEPAKAKPAKPPKPAAKPTSDGAKPGLIAALGRLPKPLVFGIFSLLIIVVMALGVLLRPAPPQGNTAGQPPAAAGTPASDQPAVVETNEQIIARHLREGKEQMAKGDPAGAIKDHFDRVLLINPDHPEALDLKMKAEEAARQLPVTPAGQPPAAGATPTASTPPANAAGAPAGGAQPAAKPVTPAAPPSGNAPVTPVAGATPAGRGATPPAAPGAPGARPATAAKAGPVTKRPGETDAAFRARSKDLQQKFQAGKAAVAKGDFAAAIVNLDAVLKDEPAYPEAAGLLTQAQAARSKAAQSAVESGTASEGGGDLVEALKHFQRAAELEPSVAGSAEGIRRVSDRMQKEGDDAYKRAKQYDALGRTAEAISMYEKAAKYLPAGSANGKAARERLEALKK